MKGQMTILVLVYIAVELLALGMLMPMIISAIQLGQNASNNTMVDLMTNFIPPLLYLSVIVGNILIYMMPRQQQY